MNIESAYIRSLLNLILHTDDSEFRDIVDISTLYDINQYSSIYCISPKKTFQIRQKGLDMLITYEFADIYYCFRLNEYTYIFGENNIIESLFSDSWMRKLFEYSEPNILYKSEMLDRINRLKIEYTSCSIVLLNNPIL